MTFASCMHDVTLNSGGISLLAALGASQYRGCVCRRGCAGVDARHRDEACPEGFSLHAGLRSQLSAEVGVSTRL